jgi:hypothetical protein
MTTYIIFQICFKIFNIQSVDNYKYNVCKLKPIKEQIPPVYGTLWRMIARVLMIDIDWLIFNEQYLILVGWNLMSIRYYRCAAFRSLMSDVDWMMFNAQYLILVGLYVMSDLIKRVRNYLCLLFTSTKSCL